MVPHDTMQLNTHLAQVLNLVALGRVNLKEPHQQRAAPLAHPCRQWVDLPCLDPLWVARACDSDVTD